MASKIGCVCYCAISVSILAFISTSDSSEAQNVGYLSLGLREEFHTEVLSLERAELHRSKRQSGSAPLSNSSSADTAASPNSSLPTPSTPSVTTPTPTPAPQPTQPAPQPSNASNTTSGPAGPQPTPAQPQSNATQKPIIKEDDHNYYRSSINPGSVEEHYKELDNPSSQGTLSSGHRLAVTVLLPFPFRFYGHNITNVTIATGGFMYVSPFLHQWLTATQYIAPLMANFDTSTSNHSNIFYKQVGEEFVVEWHNVILKDQLEAGKYVFQAKLKADGTITFVYKSLPMAVSNISSANHPVKIGLSDAFYNDTFLPQYGIKRRTIIEYHRVSFSRDQIEQGTVVVLSPLPTCNIISDCGTCTKHTGVKFNCKWCDRVSRCSDGLDWYRQNWEKEGCKEKAVEKSTHCSNTPSTPTSPFTLTPPTTEAPAPVSVAHSPAPVNTPPTPPPSPLPLHTDTLTKTVSATNATPPLSTSSPPPSPRSSSQAAGAKALAHSKMDDCGNSSDGKCPGNDNGLPAVAIVVIVLVVVALIATSAMWVFYAYTHPTSPSGMWLMEHRPSQMKVKLAKMKFWKKSTPQGTKYAVESEA